MRHYVLSVGQALALVLGILVTTGHAQDKKAPEVKPKQDKNVRGASQDKDFGVHKLTIQNGQTRTVHYFSSSSSPSESTALRELEQAENEAGYAGDLQALRQQYLGTERALENQRRQVQMALYGKSVETTTKTTHKQEETGPNPFANQIPFPSPSVGVFGGFPGLFPFARGITSPTGMATSAGLAAFPGLSFPGTGTSATPAALGLSGTAGGNFPGAGPFPSSFITGGGNPSGQSGGTSSTESFNTQTDTKVSRSLAHGMGDEGKFKTEMVAQMARQATPEYASKAARALNDAAATVALITERDPARKGVQFAAIPAEAPKVIVTLDSNEKLIGYLISEDANWLVVRTLAGESQVRPAKVMRIDKLK